MGFPVTLKALPKSPGEVGVLLALSSPHKAKLCDGGSHMWNTPVRWHSSSRCGYAAALCYLAPESCDGGGRDTSVLGVRLFWACAVLTKAAFAFSVRWFAGAVMKVGNFFLLFLNILNLSLGSKFFHSAWTWSPLCSSLCSLPPPPLCNVVFKSSWQFLSS